MASLSSTTLLNRMLDPVGRCLNEGAAKQLLRLRADAKVQARVRELAEKCNEGELSPDERQEYEMYVMMGEFIAVLQAKARVLLAQSGRNQ